LEKNSPPSFRPTINKENDNNRTFNEIINDMNGW